ncbi:CCA tRNA nucleotidyltransferase [Virgibacillus xinjiangensis]|uniref:CCA-adding enzyme n=1 Tax=Virgibacillus xinjiangensis TaxID=393090 RepID=A0ABV7CRI3_9BACI
MLPASFQTARPIIEKLEQNRHKAFFVGGCVRDLLLNRPMGDIDIATSATPAAIQRIFEKVIPVGIQHGTVIVRWGNESYEVTTFRTDGEYSDNRHPDDVQFIDNVEQDLERRDFTINALAMDKQGDIIDLFQGREDLKAKTIRTVGDGEQRFREDSLRIARALRFSSQLGFTIHPDTLSAMKKVKDDMELLAVERLANEMEKLFAGTYLHTGISYLKETGVCMHLPVIKNHPWVIDRLPASLQPLHTLGEVFALFHLLEQKIDADVWVKAWKCSNKIKNQAKLLIGAYHYFLTYGADRWLAYRLDSDNQEGFVRLANSLSPDRGLSMDHLTSMTGNLPIQSTREMDINGREIAEMFPAKKQGPWLKQLIESVEKMIVMGQLKNSKSEIKEWIKWNPPEQD